VRVRRTLLETGVPLETATDLIEAFCQDAEKNRYDSLDELMHYCRYSANPVGRFLLHLHGENPDTHGPSDALCSALQIINHLQDVASDLQTLDRCYLPSTWMMADGARIEDIKLVRSKPGLRRVLNRLLDETDKLNLEASRLPHLVRDRRMRIYCAIIVALSHRLAARLRTEDPVAGRVKLSVVDGLRAVLAGARVLV